MVREHYILSHRPRLLQLPTIYEQLFMFYHKRTCLKCHKVPKDASICLICGRLICIRDSCCRTGSVLEGVTVIFKFKLRICTLFTNFICIFFFFTDSIRKNVAPALQSIWQSIPLLLLSSAVVKLAFGAQFIWTNLAKRIATLSMFCL